ncbi:hypothetical protein [Jeotgalibacillus terrae]|uniref:DUF3139 domain-containing protein n=1 Tax=Jeotgalibacillus terrae TaxID=587735 RepID=A0ABW5ZL59_9BACL|nr:hypothetical protein [Jeotgalibacillus terrae]MBM7580967.1 hypothetical protein [Jeotgalibacillus terrae]
MKTVKLNRSQMTIAILTLTVVAFAVLQIKDMMQKPDNSLTLYQEIAFADDMEAVEALMLEGYEENLNPEAVEYMMRADRQALGIEQFTLVDFHDRTYLVESSPGTDQLYILNIEELPEEIRDYFEE